MAINIIAKWCQLWPKKKITQSFDITQSGRVILLCSVVFLFMLGCPAFQFYVTWLISVSDCCYFILYFASTMKPWRLKKAEANQPSCAQWILQFISENRQDSWKDRVRVGWGAYIYVSEVLSDHTKPTTQKNSLHFMLMIWSSLSLKVEKLYLVTC